MAVKKLLGSFNSRENLSKLNPFASKYFPYPIKKFTTSCLSEKTLPYGIVSATCLLSLYTTASALPILILVELVFFKGL